MTRTLLTLWALAAATLLAGCEPPPVDAVQRGYRGTGMMEVYHPATVQAAAALNAPPAMPAPASADGPKASAIFKNVKVLGDLSAAQFAGIMVDMTNWVAPKQGCTYCHQGADFADDTLYTKVVARRMLQMTQHINGDWTSHVAATGVTCYTCHRGNNVPSNIWYQSPDGKVSAGLLGDKAGQNAPAPQVGLTSLPNDPFTPFLEGDKQVRVIGTSALPEGNRQSIKQTEWTYGLMMHISKSLGVNCTYCHNTRSFAEWNASTPQRVTAYYGIRMARDLNTQYLQSLAGVFPPARLGPTGDVPKLNCATCHQGAYKPLNGANILQGHPGLVGVKATVAAGMSSGTATGADVYFAVGSAELTADAGKSLDGVIQSLKAAPDAKVTLSGYHSAAGTLAQNQELAKQRAFAVRDALKAAGIDETRIVLDKPQQTEANVAGEDPKARRVEVSMK
jgi:photosynthetic reaction center cytochrome c subunit